MIKQNKLQFDMDTGIEGLRNHLRRGRGHLLAYAWNRLQWNWFHRFKRVPKFPLNIDIESSSDCSLKCDHCFRQYMDMKESGRMEMDLYRKIVDECAARGLFTLKFSMRGEPTLHPQIAEMVLYAKQSGIKEVWINTHGGHLTEAMAEGFVKAGLDCLTVSFDGLGEMYESIRIPLKYEESIERLRTLAAVRKRLGARKPLIKVQTLWSAIKDDPEAYLRVMRPLVDKVSYNIDFDFKAIHFVPDPNYVCYRLWQRLAITSSGDILKCPSDFEKDEVFANVRDRSIKEVWDTLQEQERRRHLAGERLQSIACRKCHHGATVVQADKQYADRKQDVNEITYEGGFTGVGLNRQADAKGLMAQPKDRRQPKQQVGAK